MIFSMFQIFTFIDPNCAENITNLAEIVGPRMVYGVAFSNSKDPWSLVGPGCHQVSSGVVVRIVEGKSRVEALLNTALHMSGYLMELIKDKKDFKRAIRNEKWPERPKGSLSKETAVLMNFFQGSKYF